MRKFHSDIFYISCFALWAIIFNYLAELSGESDRYSVVLPLAIIVLCGFHYYIGKNENNNPKQAARILALFLAIFSLAIGIWEYPKFKYERLLENYIQKESLYKGAVEAYGEGKNESEKLWILKAQKEHVIAEAKFEMFEDNNPKFLILLPGSLSLIGWFSFFVPCKYEDEN